MLTRAIPSFYDGNVVEPRPSNRIILLQRVELDIITAEQREAQIVPRSRRLLPAVVRKTRVPDCLAGSRQMRPVLTAATLQQRICSALRGTRNLASEPDNFMDQLLTGCRYTEEGLQQATDAIYRALYYRFAGDLILDPTEKRKLEEVQRLLCIDQDHVASLNYQVGLALYKREFRDAVSDGVLTDQENTRLEQIARFFELRRADIKKAIADQALAYYSFRLAEAVKDGELSDDEREGLTLIIDRFGITHRQLRTTTVPQKKEILKTALANVKAKGNICEQDQANIRAICQMLNAEDLLTPCLKDLDLYEKIFRLRRGILPTIDKGGLILEHGEQLHYKAAATYEIQGTSRVKRRAGTLFIGSARLRFVGLKLSHQIRYQNILQVKFEERKIPRLLVSVSCGRGGGKYVFTRVKDPGYVVEVEEALNFLIRKARGLERKARGRDTRHIRPEIRHEVWYRDGGKCVICGSESYLEFDHVIPLSKGGATSVDNLQVLCRGCNLAKRDHI